MIKHLQVQLKIRKYCNIDNRFTLKCCAEELENIVRKLSEREPYIGKLSYKFAAVYLLHGYKQQFEKLNIKLHLTIPDRIGLDSFNQRMFAKNFDLR